MKIVYQLIEGELEKRDAATGNFILYKQATSEERDQFIEAYELPSDVFKFYDVPFIAPRLEYLTTSKLGDTLIFVLASISEYSEKKSVEERLESHTFILSENQLVWFINEGASNLDEELFQSERNEFNSLEGILMRASLLSYKHFTVELRRQRETIDYLDEQADHKTSNQILIDVADTERDMVMMEHTIDTQDQAISRLLEDKDFLANLDDEKLVHNIIWYNRQVNKMVHLYRDLLDTVSGLFSDIMNNTLNKLMKFLSSLSLILASSGLIAELWGMNTGGLPGEQSEYGTLILFGVAFLAGLVMFLYLNKKSYFDDD